MKFPVKDYHFQEVGQIDLPSHFEEKISLGAVYDSIKNELNNKRQGNASTKTMSEVKGSGKKPFRQKGTGRARSGSRKSPLWRGGGVVFGPHKKDYIYNLPAKVKQKALRSILADLRENGRFSVMSDLELNEYKTKTVADIFKNLKEKRLVWVISAKEKSSYYIRRSASNMTTLRLFNVESLELKDIFYADHVVFSVSAVQALTDRDKGNEKQNKLRK